jgi:type IV pilus assembly protein PilY1
MKPILVPPPHHQHSLGRRSFGRLTAGAIGAAILSSACPAFAQADLNPPLPNMLLLVDTSGSMEFKTDGSEPACNPNEPNNDNERSRWIDLVEVLTGSIDEFTCEALDRSSADFTNSYRFGTTGEPYDYQYPIPYHRPLSHGCGPAPGTAFDLSTNPLKYPASNATSKPIDYHDYNFGASCNTWSQDKNDGVLDTFRSLVRFGLMTFDSSVNEGTGYDGQSVNHQSGRDGLWTYAIGELAAGQPFGCGDLDPPKQEVGARNNAAPPWEGRLVNFGNPDDGVRAYELKNSQIQQVLVATRPYGATPIAGMLRDAQDFLLNDQATDPDPYPPSPAPSGFKGDFGPYRDQYLACGRKQAILLLTDGLPNMDLRPACEGASEPSPDCPFEKPETIADSLNKDKNIRTYVVGFALDSYVDASGVEQTCAKTVNCTGVTIESPAAIQACCALQKIAVAGGGTAYFANDKAALRSQIHGILSQAVATTSRTQPAVGGGGSAASGSYRFFSGFLPGPAGTADAPGRPWAGVLDRQRWLCNDDNEPEPVPIDEDVGDKFVANVDKAGPLNRLIYTYVGDVVDTEIKSGNTIRPLLNGTDPGDGSGAYAADVEGKKTDDFISALPTAALGIPEASCVDQDGQALVGSACPEFYLKWLLGRNNGSGYQRCESPGVNCSLVGDIFHSTPQVVGPPTTLTRDESYARFSYLQADRPVVVYTSTNDGFLHAFRADAASNSTSNELWAFIPPATLPNLHTQYPFSHGFLLDGIPVVSDVVAVDPGPDAGLPVVFERNQLDAQEASNLWRTVLVQSFGAEHPGYFAVDVTDPVPDADEFEDLSEGGPRLLWQLTTDAEGANLFGRGGATPAITTLFFDPKGGDDPREIPVAVLPGGPGGTVQTEPAQARTFTDSTIDTRFPPRSQVRSYDPATISGARSLTIVRLDTGEIIRTFRQAANELNSNTSLKARVTEVPTLDSPITGQPVAFPGMVGAVADRIYVGDNDGRFWKIDVSGRKPAEWKMQLFFDLYPESFNGVSSGLDFDDGQPVMTVPALSVDEHGNVTVNIATGDQDKLGSAPDQTNFVYSLTDKVTTSGGPETVLNWYKKLTGGERAVGPLALFNGYLYFATFRPAEAGTPCLSGASSVWGMHYLEPKTLAEPGDGGVPAPDFPNQFIEQSENAVVFGVSVVQQPSCFDVEELAEAGFLGFGTRRRFSNVQSGKFQLLMHMGDTSQGTGNTDATDSSVSSKAIDLATPTNGSQITGWASVLE